MSLINQVLNQLEQRGAHTAPDQTQVRAVPPHVGSDWLKPMLLAAGLLLIGAVGAWLWTHKSPAQPKQPPAEVVTTPPTMAAQPVIENNAAPAARLSYELSSLPLPDALREPKPVTVETVIEERPLVADMSLEKRPVSKPARPTPPSAVSQDTATPLKQVSPKQRADAAYRRGLQMQQARKVPEALAAYEEALGLDVQHEAARLAMSALLLENGQQAAAERLLQAGLELKQAHLSFAISLARMQLARAQLALAAETLQAQIDKADKNADYQSFYAALLQRQEKHEEAVKHYQIALQILPRNGVWRMGYAISLQALSRTEDAKLAYKQALATHTLTPELTAFVEQRLAGLNSACATAQCAPPPTH